jgi:hypothetical protein
MSEEIARRMDAARRRMDEIGARLQRALDGPPQEEGARGALTVTRVESSDVQASAGAAAARRWRVEMSLGLLGEQGRAPVTAQLGVANWNQREAQSGYPLLSGLPRHGQTPDADDPWRARGRGVDLGLWADHANTPPVYDSLMEPVQALAGRDWEVKPAVLGPYANDDDKRLRDKHAELISRALERWPTGARRALVEEALFNVPRAGFGLWEIVTERALLPMAGAGPGGTWHLPLPPKWIEPSAVEWWISDLEKLLGVLFDFSHVTDYFGGMGGRVLVPIEKLLHVRHLGHGANWEGRSALRPAYISTELWRAVMQLQGLAAEVGALGFHVLKQKEKAASVELAALQGEMNSFVARISAYLSLPYGYEHEFTSPGEMVGDLTGLLEYLERQIKATLNHESSLIGMLSAAGSYALAAERGDESRRSYEYVVRRLVSDPVSDQLFRRVLQLNFPGDAIIYAPTLEPRDVTARDTRSWLADVIAARSAGLLEGDTPISLQVLQELGLPAPQTPSPLTDPVSQSTL